MRLIYALIKRVSSVVEYLGVCSVYSISDVYMCIYV